MAWTRPTLIAPTDDAEENVAEAVAQQPHQRHKKNCRQRRAGDVGAVAGEQQIVQVLRVQQVELTVQEGVGEVDVMGRQRLLQPHPRGGDSVGTKSRASPHKRVLGENGGSGRAASVME
jgi:hypothetical protein